MKIEHVLFPSVFFKITDPFDGRSFLMCSHDPFFETNKNRNLKNGSCEQAFRANIYCKSCCDKVNVSGHSALFHLRLLSCQC